MPNTLKMNNGSTYITCREFTQHITNPSNGPYFKVFAIKKTDIENAKNSGGQITPIDISNQLKPAFSLSGADTFTYIPPLLAPARNNTNVFEVYWARNSDDTGKRMEIKYVSLSPNGNNDLNVSVVGRYYNTVYTGVNTSSGHQAINN